MIKPIAILWLALILIVFTVGVFATMSSPMNWNIETTSGASNTNGGGYNPAAAGTNFSLSTNNSGSCAAKVNVDNGTITASLTASTLTFNTGYTPSAADVGNVWNYISETGGTAGTFARYEITAMSVGSKTWTFDRTTGASGATVTSGKMGGCLTLDDTTFATATATGSGTVPVYYIKQGTYTPSAQITLRVVSGGVSGRIYGYASTQGDCPHDSTRPLIQPTGASYTLFSATANGSWEVACLQYDGTNATAVFPFIFRDGTSSVSWTKIINVGNAVGIWTTGGSGGLSVFNTEISGSTNASGAIFAQSSMSLFCDYCNLHNNTQAIKNLASAGGSITHSAWWSNTNGPELGAAQQGGGVVEFNVMDANSGYALSFINAFSSVGSAYLVANNVITNNGIGIQGDFGVMVDNPNWNCNAYRGNTNDFTNGVVAGANDVTLTADPYTARTASPPDFTPNSTAGGGAALKGAGCPASLPGLTGVNAPTIGAYQPAASGGGQVAFPIVK